MKQWSHIIYFNDNFATLFFRHKKIYATDMRIYGKNMYELTIDLMRKNRKRSISIPFHYLMKSYGDRCPESLSHCK